MSKLGHFIRNKRIEAGISLRKAAEMMGVSHVFLGEVERGVRASLSHDRWADLIRAVPTITLEDLERHSALTRPVQLDLRDAPLRYQDLGLALARRIEKRDLPEGQLQLMLDLLKEPTGE
jgi:transcriptional regulator with XRE-family HTH domain